MSAPTDYQKITDLAEITSLASGDLHFVVDVSDTTQSSDGTSKKIQQQYVTAGLAPTASPTFTGVVTIPTPFTLGAVSVTPTGTELNHVAGVTSDIQTQLDAKAPLVSPSFTTPALGVATGTSINKVAITAPASSATLTIANTKTLTASDTTTLATNSITMGGGEVITFSATNALSLLTAGTSVMTFPTATDTVAVLGTAQTYTATQTEKQVVWTNNAIAASSNAATVPITHRLHTVTNNSAATLTITMTTTSAVDGQMVIVRILDFSAVAQTIIWVNTENSTISAPIVSNGSTTLFLTAGFIYNGATSKWRCIASA